MNQVNDACESALLANLYCLTVKISE